MAPEPDAPMPQHADQPAQAAADGAAPRGPQRGSYRWHALTAAVVLAAVAYYRLRWPTFEALVGAFDYMPFLQDFVGHYHPMGSQILRDPTPVPGYLYPSFFAVLLAPVGALDQAQAVVVWTVLQLVLVAVLCRVSALGGARPTPPGIAAVTALVVTSTPVLHNLKWGQVSILITVCLVGALAAHRRDRAGRSGTLLAFATAIKLYPGLFALLFVLRREWRAFAAFAMAALAFYVVVPMLVLGLDGWWNFEKAIAAGARHLDVAGNISSQSAANVVARWSFLATGRTIEPGLLAILRDVSRTVGIACLLLALPLRRRDPDGGRVLPLVAVLLSLPFLLETSWPHYFVHLPFCQVAVLAHARTLASGHPDPRTRRTAHWLAGLSLASIALASVFCLDLSGHWSNYHGYGVLFVANLLLLVALALAAKKVAPELVRTGTRPTIPA